MSSLKRGDIVRVVIDRLAFEGPGVARLDGGVDSEGKPRKLVVFVDGAAPGDEVEVELYSMRRGLLRGRVKRFIKYAEQGRVAPKCPHFGVKVGQDGETKAFTEDGNFDLNANCGGCTWQFLAYEEQLKVKEELVRDALTRIGCFSAEVLDAVWKPIIGAETPWFYRNKMDFSFGRDRDNGLHLGLHIKGRFRDICEIKSCDLFRPWVGELLGVMREFFGELVVNDGELKSLVVRAGTNTSEVLVNLQVENFLDVSWTDDFTNAVKDFFEKLDGDKLVSVFLTNIHNKKGQPKRFEESLLWGETVFNEILRVGERELRFEVAPAAFLQPNTKQAEKLYSLVRELAALHGNERVFDVFCGTGTIGLVLADGAREVVGLELNEAAVENARRNAALNGVSNMSFLVGNATKLMPEMGSDVDLIVIDPPRAGVTEKVIDAIVATSAKRLVYVSCNPPTLARDLKLLTEKGFQLKFVQPVDQFSQTYHIETVTMLER
jgi:23S rRNA (uracil1939-C5)-methyltransferase